MTRTKELSDFSGADVFDIRDVIARFEELETDLEGFEDKSGCEYDDLKQEHDTLKNFLDSVEGRGGDEQWRGSWYPVAFIADSYFEDYTREFASDVYGREIDEAKWPFDCIDWSKAADELRVDYSSVDLDGNEFWYR